MEAAPPSYEKATLVNAWHLVADYLPLRDLLSVALVCKAWHAIFVPHIWGNPASQFGGNNERICVALTEFKHTLAGARLQVRSFTHTLILPPAHAELYDGPHADWLREALDRLPNLQSLVVRGLPFFDHAALLALRYKTSKGQLPNVPPKADARETPRLITTQSTLPPIRPQAVVETLPVFNLRLLDASRCRNVTAVALSQAMTRLESLLYLDLSWTYAARDPVVLASLRTIAGLQVLKLRNIALRDPDVAVLAKAIGTRVRSLDIRNNEISDRSVPLLLETCVRNTLNSDRDDGSSSAGPLPFIGSDMLSIYRGAEFESYLRNIFTRGFVSRLAIEDVPDGGITHLYISQNRLTVEGLCGLLRPGALHVLDASIGPAHMAGITAKKTASSHVASPGAEKLAAVLGGSMHAVLAHIRINHEIVTGTASDTQGLQSASQEATSTIEHDFEASDPAGSGGLLPLPPDALSPPTNVAERLSPIYSHLEALRKARIDHHLQNADGYHPVLLPSLVTLVLTHVPPFSTTPTISERIISLISECAQEAQLASQQARADYTLPPGRRESPQTLQQSAHRFFALKHIVLEMAREEPRQGSVGSAVRRQGTMRSMTEDRDGETLWSAAESDFSFFGESDEDLITDDQIRAGSSVASRDQVEEAEEPMIDNIARLAAYRKEKKQAFETMLARGESDPVVVGYWPGVVTVVRPGADSVAADDNEEQEMDYYGNRFSHAGTYR